MGAGGHASRDAVLGVTLSFTILAVFAASLRLSTRFFISKAAGADDTFAAISTVSISQCPRLNTLLTETDPHGCTNCRSLGSRLDKPTLPSCRVPIVLTSHSQVRPVTTCEHPHQARRALDDDMVLELNLDISISSVRCQDVHPVTIPSHLHSALVSQGQHWVDRVRCCLLRLDEL
jgi:hypothetical protein